ncbi:MAG TPA: diaminopimelate decarboxylase [Actinomycetota bacterium]|nr:diaminopimelate decarboxylase [Actinomycetota bacterium]
MPEPWPDHAAFGPDGLRIAGIAAEELAHRYGTPLLVVDEEHLRARARTFASLFPHPLYAVKAFTSRAVIRLVAEEGLDLLASTGGELEACLRAGVPGERIVLHGNNKSDEELRQAVTTGVRLVNVDNGEELERLDAVSRTTGVVQSIMLRVIPEVGAGAHRKIMTGGAGSKFGTALPLVPGTVRRAMDLEHVRLVGIHSHVGSQVLEVAPYLAAIDVLLDLLLRLRDETGFEAELVDVGGGFGVAYTDEDPIALDELAPALLARVREGAKRRGLPVPHVLVEPGRSVVGTSTITLYRVGTVKASHGGRELVAVDGGMSDNIRPMLYGARYTVALAGPPRAPSLTAVDVVGRHCESGDVLAQDVKVPHELRPGDLIAFAATGAYTYSMASTYNRIGRPAVVAVREGRALPWLRREDAADLDRLEALQPAVGSTSVPPGIVVRPARPRDARSFLASYREVAAERRRIQTETVDRSVGYFRKRFRRPWDRTGAHLLALDGDRVVGSLSIRRHAEHAALEHVATLGMHVVGSHRRRGVGSALMAEALRWARRYGVERVELTVYPHNEAAIALYRRFGFVEEGRLVRHAKKSYGYEDEVLMAVWVGPEPARSDPDAEGA